MGGRILQVSNISKEARRSDIKDLFSQYGYILDCYMGRRDCTIVSFGEGGRWAQDPLLEPPKQKSIRIFEALDRINLPLESVSLGNLRKKLDLDLDF